MTQNLNKKILITTELASSVVGIFFQELGIELHHKYIEGQEYLFAVNDACPEQVNIPRLQTNETLNPALLKNVRSFISEEMFKTTLGKKLLVSYFSESHDFDLVERYSKDFKNIYNIKIHEYLNVGFFIDSIIVEAYKAGFDIDKLRNYLHTSISFAFKKAELASEPMPLDVSYSHNGEAFTVQVSLQTENFTGKDELDEVLKTLTENSNFFDLSYFKKTNKLTLSSLVFKDKVYAKCRSFFFTEISAKAAAGEVTEKPGVVDSGLVAKESPRYEMSQAASEQSKKLALARKFAFFIKNYRQSEASPKSPDRLELIDVEYYLTFYPRQEALKDVDDEIKNFIFKLIKDEQLFDSISDYVQKIANSNLDAQVQEIQRVLGEKSLDDIEEMLLIRGGGKDEDAEEKSSRVKGWLESRAEVQLINGADDPLTNDEKWAVKRTQIAAGIENEIIRVKGSGRNIIEEDIIRVVAHELGADEKDVKTVVSGVIEEVVSRELVKNQKLEEAFALKILGETAPNQVREKLESQILRMKKVMDQMKHELIKLQNEKKSRESTIEIPDAVIDNNDAMKLRSALTKAMDILKGKERLLEKSRSDFDINLKVKDQKIIALEEKIDELKNEFARSREFANEEKLQQLEVENKSLVSRLELANKKVNIISENIENRDNEALDKRERELESLRANMQMAQSVIERFKNDKLEMETRYQIEKETNRKLKEERDTQGSIGSKNEMLEKDNLIVAMTNEKKAMEEKFKVMTLELKKTEQKLKFATSQLESSNKKKGPAAGQKSAEAYAKQLEQANGRLAESANELAEKRKEAIKLKQENTLLSSKIAELEKKLGIADKKAS